MNSIALLFKNWLYMVVIFCTYNIHISYGLDLFCGGGEGTGDDTCIVNQTAFPFSNNFYYYSVGSLHCYRQYIIDISNLYTSEEDFKFLQNFLQLSSSTCHSSGVGKSMIFRTNLNHSDNTYSCCDDASCSDIINNFTLADLSSIYWTPESVFDGGQNFSSLSTSFGEWEQLMKDLVPSKCARNSIVYVTNRLFDFEWFNQNYKPPNKFLAFMHDVLNYGCSTLTTIIVGRHDIKQEEADAQYSNFSENVYVVPDYKCLLNLYPCLYPCASSVENLCTSISLDNCGDVVIPTTLPTTTTTELYPDFPHLIYIIVLSNRTSNTSYYEIMNSLVPPLKNVYDDGFILTTAFVTSVSQVSNWMTTADDVSAYIPTINYSQSAFVSSVIDDTDSIMTYRVLKATNISPSNRNTTLILITDTISYDFFDQTSDTGSPLYKELIKYRNLIYVTDATAYYYYEHNITSFLFHDVIYLNNSNTQVPLPFPTKQVPTASPHNKLNESTIIIIIFGVIVGALAILCGASCIYRQKMKWKLRIEDIRANHRRRDVDYTGEEDFWELKWEDVVITADQQLGKGAFGCVRRGKLHRVPPSYEHYYKNISMKNFQIDCGQIEVAVKTLKRPDGDSEKKFMKEIDMMKMLGYHENIVNMLGCITRGTPKALVLEYCQHQDLLMFMEDIKMSTHPMELQAYSRTFLSFAWQIAQGMKYLSSKGIVHRDLAARNILIDKRHNAKICDFGLCIQIKKDHNGGRVTASTGMVPLKWLPIEALKSHEFSLKTDVWSFGILVYEMFSFGETPFANIEPVNLIYHLENGNRPSKPEHCTDAVYKVMTRCWSANPELRPTFDELLTTISIFLDQSTAGYGYLSLLKLSNEVPTDEALSEPPPPPKSNQKRHSNDSPGFFASISRQISQLANKSAKNNNNTGNTGNITPIMEDDNRPTGRHSRPASESDTTNYGVSFGDRTRTRSSVPEIATDSIRHLRSFRKQNRVKKSLFPSQSINHGDGSMHRKIGVRGMHHETPALPRVTVTQDPKGDYYDKVP